MYSTGIGELYHMKALVSKGRAAALSDEARKDGSMTDEEVARSLEIGRRPKKLDGCGSPLDCAGLRGTAGRPGPLDAEIIGGPAGGVRDSGEHPPRDGAQDAEKNELKPWLKECWCIPPKGSSDFVCAMEDVLEVYHRPCEDNEVLVCLDETSKQQVKETRQPRPAPDWQPRMITNMSVHAVCAAGLTDRRTKVTGRTK